MVVEAWHHRSTEATDILSEPTIFKLKWSFSPRSSSWPKYSEVEFCDLRLVSIDVLWLLYKKPIKHYICIFYAARMVSICNGNMALQKW